MGYLTVEDMIHAARSTRKSFKTGRPGNKIKKAAKKHRFDHSNPGGVVSDFFREKNTRIF